MSANRGLGVGTKTVLSSKLRVVAAGNPRGLADTVGSNLPITVVRNGALVDVIVTPTELT